MARVQPVDYEQATPQARAAHDAEVQARGSITNMKRTLLRSLPAFHAMMRWYTLRDTVEPFLGRRLATLFSLAISAENDCLVCTTYFRRSLIDAGEDPEQFTLDEREQAVMDFGRAMATDRARVPDAVYARMATHFTDEQIVALTAFGAIMIASNAFNSALEVELDGYLEPYRKAAAPAQAGD